MKHSRSPYFAIAAFLATGMFIGGFLDAALASAKIETNKIYCTYLAQGKHYFTFSVDQGSLWFYVVSVDEF